AAVVVERQVRRQTPSAEVHYRHGKVGITALRQDGAKTGGFSSTKRRMAYQILRLAPQFVIRVIHTSSILRERSGSESAKEFGQCSRWRPTGRFGSQRVLIGKPLVRRLRRAVAHLYQEHRGCGSGACPARDDGPAGSAAGCVAGLVNSDFLRIGGGPLKLRS